MTAKILLVDDDATMLQMVKSHLEAAGYSVAMAVNGFEGLRLAREWQPDLMLLDVMMPVMDGFTTCARVREFSSIPIIIVTAKGEEGDLVRGLDAGADDYVIKPYSAHELLARVRAVLRRVDPEGLEAYQHLTFKHQGLVIDVDRALVTVDGESVDLTATEFKVLTALAASMGEILSAVDLLNEVWGPDYRREKTILWVTLSRLRQKIEPDPKNPIHIVTHQGLGYSMPHPPAE